MSADTFVSPAQANPSRSSANVRANETSERSRERSPEFSPYAANLRRALFAVFVANALTQFAIQAWMAWRFGLEVWKLPGPLAIGVPIALDVFVINLMVVAYLERQARLRTRIYVWIVLTIGIAAQLGAAEAFADFKDWSKPARLASLVPAAFLAFALHTLIIVAQHSDRASDGARRATWGEARRARALVKALRKSGTADPVIPPPVVRANLQTQIVGLTPPPAPAPPAPVAVPPPTAPVAVPPPTAPRPRPATRPARQASKPATSEKPRSPRANPNRELAIKRVQAGEPAAAVAGSLGVSTRVVQIWVKGARDHAPSITDAPVIAPGETTGADAPIPKGLP
jgi:hypothetical protein